MRLPTQSLATRATTALAVVLLVTVLGSRAQESAAGEKKQGPEQFCVLPASYQMRPAVFVLARDSQNVGFSLFRETTLGLEPYSRAELRDLRLNWRQCLQLGQETATRHLKTLKPEIFRDSRGILSYAHFKSENPLTASILISPEFRSMFENTLGKELYVAVPDRFNVFVFPKYSDSIKKLRSKMAILYKEGLYPVSREFFEVSNKGIRVTGTF